MLDRKTRTRYARQARVLQALAHPLRLAIADHLRAGERCVCDIAAHIGTSRPNISRHLAVMHRAGVLASRKQGLMVFYALRTPCVLNFLACATNVLKKNLRQDARALGRV